MIKLRDFTSKSEIQCVGKKTLSWIKSQKLSVAGIRVFYAVKLLRIFSEDGCIFVNKTDYKHLLLETQNDEVAI